MVVLKGDSPRGAVQAAAPVVRVDVSPVNVCATPMRSNAGLTLLRAHRMEELSACALHMLGLMRMTRTDARPATSIASSRAKNRATCRRNVLKQFQPFLRHRLLRNVETGDVAARSREARDEAAADRKQARRRWRWCACIAAVRLWSLWCRKR